MEKIESPTNITEQTINDIREAWAIRMEDIFTGTKAPLDEETFKVIDKIRNGEKLPKDSWAGDALPNLPIMRTLSFDERLQILDLFLS